MTGTNTAPPLWVRLIDVLFVAIAIIDFYNSLVLYPVVIIPAFAFLKPAVFALNAVVSVGTVGILAFIFIRWQLDVNKGIPDNGRRHAWFTGIIRYWLAVEIFNYAFAKVLGTQFGVNYFRGDSTWSSLSGFDLTWNYFGYSPVLSDIIAGFQLVGSGMLLFRRTTVMGSLLLLPVMVNVVLIDIFYHIPAGALVNACLFTAALLYLLALHYKEITVFFRSAVLRLPEVRLRGWKGVIRLLVMAYGFGFIYFVTTTKQPASITGKWHVKELVLNGDTMKRMDWLENKKDWQNIYLENYGRATFSPNPYVVETGRSAVGLYRCDVNANKISFDIDLDADGRRVPYTACIVRRDGPVMEWVMTGQQDTIRMVMTKVQ